jgi:type VI secretion system secreted protein Hcp
MAIDSFLKITEIPGESQDKQFTNQIEVLSFSFGSSMPANVSGGGLGAGKVTISDFTVVKRVDKGTPKFFGSACAGTHLQSIVFSLRKAGGGTSGGYVYLTFTLTDAIVTQFHISGSGDTTTETVSLAFAQIKIEYFQQTATGSVASTGAVGWNIATNSST